MFYIVIDKEIAGGRTFIEAIDRLFKVKFNVFNLEYPLTILSVYKFLASYVYEIEPKESCTPSVRLFASSLSKAVV